MKYRDTYQSYWDAGILTVPSDPSKKASILGNFCEEWERFNNRDTIEGWAKEYPDYDVTVLITGDMIVVSPNGPITTDFTNKLPLSPHPICYFGNGRSRHFFINPGHTVFNNTLMMLRGMAYVKKEFQSPLQWEKEIISIFGRGWILHIPPTVCQLTGSEFYWDPSPWEVIMPEVDISLFKIERDNLKIDFNPD